MPTSFAKSLKARQAIARAANILSKTTPANLSVVSMHLRDDNLVLNLAGGTEIAVSVESVRLILDPKPATPPARVG
jgi:hypothetical protein